MKGRVSTGLRWKRFGPMVPTEIVMIPIEASGVLRVNDLVRTPMGGGNSAESDVCFEMV
jgi:hypothetical protein